MSRFFKMMIRHRTLTTLPITRERGLIYLLIKITFSFHWNNLLWKSLISKWTKMGDIWVKGEGYVVRHPTFKVRIMFDVASFERNTKRSSFKAPPPLLLIRLRTSYRHETWSECVQWSNESIYYWNMVRSCY